MNWATKIILLSLLVLLTSAPVVLAQGEDFIVNWKSNGSAPSFYQGKILPTRTGGLQVGFELVTNGVVANLNNKEIQWVVDRKLIAQGRGLQTIEILPDSLNGEGILVKIIVKNFRGRDLKKLVIIPTTRPEAIIERLATGLFRVWNFFFSTTADNLVYSWEVNSQKSEGLVESPFLLELDIPDNLVGTLNIRATIHNRLNLLEVAKNMLIMKL